MDMKIKSTSKLSQSSQATTVIKIPEEEYIFTWKIVNFKALHEASNEVRVRDDDLKQLCVEKCIKSPDFSTGKSNGSAKTVWRLLLFPRLTIASLRGEGINRQVVMGKYAGIHFDSDNISSSINRGTCSIILLTSDGKEVHTIAGKYKVENSIRALEKLKFFILEKDLFSREELLPNDTLTVRCHLKLMYRCTFENFTTKSSMQNLNVPQLLCDMRDLLESERHCDITICCNGSEFRAHKAILSVRSPVFANMFQRDMMEKNNTVHIEDIEKDVMKEFLRHIYGNVIGELDLTLCIGLYAAADKYDISDLKRYCVASMKSILNVGNVCDVAILADKHSDKELFSSIQKFVKKHAYELLYSESWKEFVQNNHGVANRINNC